MARKQSKKRQSKQVYLFVVEGFTEENYIKILKKIYRKSAELENCGGGSAKNVMHQAKKLITKHKDDYSGYIVWFDKDTYSPDDVNDKHSLESRANVIVCISEPCIENWMLSHFQPPLHPSSTCDNCKNSLKKHIPNYEKNDCILLEKHINETNIATALINCPNLSPIVERFR